MLSSSSRPSTPASAAVLDPRKTPILQDLRWLPDGSAVLAMDRAGNLGVVDSRGTVQRICLETTSPKVSVQIMASDHDIKC